MVVDAQDPWKEPHRLDVGEPPCLGIGISRGIDLWECVDEWWSLVESV